jgi:Lipocalin-like domain
MKTSIVAPVKVLSAVSFILGLMLFGTSTGWAQQKAGASAKQLVGTWTLVSASTTPPDGKTFQTFGSNPQGLLIFVANGRYSLQICRTGRAKFASNARDKGTAEENQATVQGCNPHWGKYSVDKKDRAIIFHIEHAMYPNWEGIEQKRPFTIAGDELKYVVPAASTGGTSDLVWKRVK